MKGTQCKKRRIIYVAMCFTCPFYDVDDQRCNKLHRAVKPWDGIDSACPLEKELL